MDAFEQHVRSQVLPEEKESMIAPGLVLAAENKSGSLRYIKAFGHESIDPSNTTPMTLDSVGWLASCTKLVTTIAVLQCVEKGLLSLDQDITSVLPEWKDVMVITGFDEKTGEATLKPASTKITLWHLVTHTSGMGYDTWEPPLYRYNTARGRDINIATNTAERFSTVLMHEPGSQWNYSPGLDWASLMVDLPQHISTKHDLTGLQVQKVTGTPFGDYVQTHIFDPLAITDMTFHPEHRPDMSNRLLSRVFRLGDGSLIPTPPSSWDVVQSDEQGGSGLYGTTPAYMQILTAILRSDPAILTQRSYDTMFAPQFDARLDATIKHVALVSSVETARGMGLPDKVFRNTYFATVPDEAAITQGMGGMLAVDGVQGSLSPGSLMWSGAAGCYWWIDRTAGVCGFLFQQIMLDHQAGVDLLDAFQKTIYGVL